MSWTIVACTAISVFIGSLVMFVGMIIGNEYRGRKSRQKDRLMKDESLLHPVAKPRPLRYELTVKRIGGPGDQLLYKIPDFCVALKACGNATGLFVACMKTMCVDSLWIAKQEQLKCEDIQAEIDKLEKELAELSGGPHESSI